MPGLKLNGLTVTKEKIWSKNTGRAANGEMVGDLIAIKYTLKCSWPPLTREQAVVIDKAVSPAFFNVQVWIWNISAALSQVYSFLFYAFMSIP